jgi:hypothetical protein
MFALLSDAEKTIREQATVVIIGFGNVAAAHSIVKQTGFSGEVTLTFVCTIPLLKLDNFANFVRYTWSKKPPLSSPTV